MSKLERRLAIQNVNKTSETLMDLPKNETYKCLEKPKKPNSALVRNNVAITTNGEDFSLFMRKIKIVSQENEPKFIFLENRSMSHLMVYCSPSLCKKSEETNDKISRKSRNLIFGLFWPKVVQKNNFRKSVSITFVVVQKNRKIK